LDTILPHFYDRVQYLMVIKYDVSDIPQVKSSRFAA
jgi:hypothetical protein